MTKRNMLDACPVPLVECENGKLRLNQDALKEYFHQEVFHNRSICIISIAGAMRTGKSFLLNFLQRYFASLENENSEWQEWISDGEASVTGGFLWTNGIKAVTKGIQVWGKPFVVKRKDGKEVVVVLMDTQGLFDNETPTAESIKLFTLSAIASSVQLVNIQKFIRKWDFETLQLCVEFGKLFADRKGSKVKQFQSLLLLVRDWAIQEKDDKYGLEGGEKHLDEVLKKNGCPELDRDRDFFLKTFKDVQCFLMPRPGEKALTYLFNGKIGDLADDFLREVKNLCENLFHPDKLVIKMNENQPMTARTLVHIFVACDEAFSCSELPPIQTLAEVYARARLEAVYRDCVEVYKSRMQVLLPDRNLILSTLDKVEETHKKAYDECVKKYDSKVVHETREYVKEYRGYLETECKEYLDIVKEKVEFYVKACECSIREEAASIENEYASKMTECWSGKPLSEEEFAARHAEYSEECVEKFYRISSKYNKICQSILEELRLNICKFYAGKISENEEKRETEEKYKDDAENLRLYELNDRLLHELNREFETERYVDRNVLEERFDECKRDIFRKYDKATKDVNGFKREMYEQKLKKMMKVTYKEIERRNEEKLLAFEERLNIWSNTLRLDYNSMMDSNLFLGGNHFKKEALRRTHENFKEVLMEQVRLRYARSATVDAFMARLGKLLDHEFENIKIKNEKNRRAGVTKTAIAVLKTVILPIVIELMKRAPLLL